MTGLLPTKRNNDAMSERAVFSGGPIRAFEKGWAILPFVGEKVHYWVGCAKKDGEYQGYYSRCGIVRPRNPRASMLHGGGFEKDHRCKSCAKQQKRFEFPGAV